MEDINKVFMGESPYRKAIANSLASAGIVTSAAEKLWGNTEKTRDAGKQMAFMKMREIKMNVQYGRGLFA